MGEQLEGFLDELCTRHQLLSAIFVLAVALIVIQLPYLFFVEWGTALFVISTMNVVGFGAFALVSGFLLRHCHERLEN